MGWLARTGGVGWRTSFLGGAQVETVVCVCVGRANRARGTKGGGFEVRMSWGWWVFFSTSAVSSLPSFLSYLVCDLFEVYRRQTA